MGILKALGIGAKSSSRARTSIGPADLPAASQVILKTLVDHFQDTGLHAPTILSASGALSGFAAQQSVLKEFVEKQGQPLEKHFAVAETEGGERFLFSETVNQLIASDGGELISLWRLVSRFAVESGAPKLPDLHAIFASTAERVGSTPFPVFSTPDHIRPREEPTFALRRLWPIMLPIMEEHCEGHMVWPIATAFSAAALIPMSRNTVEPFHAATLIMESAVAMSKVTGIHPVH